VPGRRDSRVPVAWKCRAKRVGSRIEDERGGSPGTGPQSRHVGTREPTSKHSFGDTVVVTGQLKLESEGATYVPGRDWVKAPGSVSVPATLSFTRVWIKRDGKRLLAAIYNAVPRPPPPVR